MKRYLEIRAAEGGDDSKIFVKELASAYTKMFSRFGWKHRLVDTREGELTIEVIGEDLSELQKEAGGHRIQRVPPTERKGRVHTSTVTVAVLEKVETELKVNDSEFKIEWYSGTGCGGQNRNKVQSSCRLTHIPSGIVATAQTRSRENSLKEAKATIMAKLESAHRSDLAGDEARTRKSQVGTGMRGDKRRTYLFQHGKVKDDVSGNEITAQKAMAGYLNLLW